MLHKQYSATSELRLNDRLEKLEKHSHKLLNISEYLVYIKYPKARDHTEEVKEFIETLEKCSIDVFTMFHERHAAAGSAAIAPSGAAAAAPRPNLKPSASELKPSTLSHDSSTATFRAWKKRFKAYYDASGIIFLVYSNRHIYPTVLMTPLKPASTVRPPRPPQFILLSTGYTHVSRLWMLLS